MAINVKQLKNRRITGMHNSMVGKLVQSGIITQEQLNTALAENKRTNEPLISILIKRGFVSENKMKELMSRELHMEHRSDISSLKVPREALEIFTAEELKQHRCIPIELRDEKLFMGVSDPSNIVAMDIIRERLVEKGKNWELHFVLVNEGQIYEKVDELFERGPIFAGDEEIENMIRVALREVTQADVGGADLLPIQTLVDRFVSLGHLWKASDIHINPTDSHVQIRYRLDGVLYPGPSLPLELHPSIVSRIKVMAHLNISERRAPQDGKIIFHKEDEGIDLDLRVSIIPTCYGENIVIRILQRNRLFQMSSLGMPQDVLDELNRIASLTHGMFLVTGPTGSGKSTTLYALLQTLNAIEKNIVTLEDPIEYQMPSIRQSQINPAVGYDFATGLRVFLRHDPDVILVGEIRDRETAAMAFHAAQTGHMVFSTLHTNTAISAMTRLMTMEIDPFLLSTILQGVLAQRLIRNICPSCKEEYQSTEFENTWLKLDSSTPLFRGKGCSRCKERGYLGRKGIFELFLPNEEIRHLITLQKSEMEIKNAARNSDMKFFYQDAREKVLRGETTFKEVLRVLPDLAVI